MANARAICYTKVGSLLLYLGYALLFYGITRSFVKTDYKYNKKYVLKNLFLTTFLLCIGIILQHFAIKRMLILLFTMFAIISTACMSDKFIKKATDFRSIAYGIVGGSISCAVLSLVNGIPLFGISDEGVFGIYVCYNGGIQDKNVATIMLAVIISLIICNVVGNNKRKSDLIIISLSFVIILASISRGAWIHTAFFLCILKYKSITKMDKKTRIFAAIIVGGAVLALSVFLFKNVFSNSRTYMYRVRGWTNYIRMFGNDKRIMLIGNGKIAYDQGEDYTRAIRSVTGWDGTLEIAWLNILIKNGLIGIVGFIILFWRALKEAFKCEDKNIKRIYLAVTLTLIITSFVATYISNSRQLLGIFSYLVMSYFKGKINQKDDEGVMSFFIKQKIQGEKYG